MLERALDLLPARADPDWLPACHFLGTSLAARFQRPFLRLSAATHRRFLRGLADRGVAGGAVYDALIAATAAEAGAELVTCDRRAQVTYAKYGVRVLSL